MLRSISPRSPWGYAIAIRVALADDKKQIEDTLMFEKLYAAKDSRTPALVFAGAMNSRSCFSFASALAAEAFRRAATPDAKQLADDCDKAAALMTFRRGSKTIDSPDQRG